MLAPYHWPINTRAPQTQSPMQWYNHVNEIAMKAFIYVVSAYFTALFQFSLFHFSFPFRLLRPMKYATHKCNWERGREMKLMSMFIFKLALIRTVFRSSDSGMWATLAAFIRSASRSLLHGCAFHWHILANHQQAFQLNYRIRL